MEEYAGRGFREKIPSAKLKESVHEKVSGDKNDHIKARNIVPTYIAPKDPRFENEQKEIAKTLDHTKIGADGERIEFYSLGNQ